MLPSPSSQENAGASKMHLDSMSLISFDPSVIVNDPQWSPPSTANTQVESRIFQFPPQQPLIKQEDPTWTTLQEPGAGFSSIVPVSSSSPQCSPMAISPSMSTLNTPRGSITSMRSQQSPMDQQHPGSGLPDPIMSNYEPFDAAPPAFVSYTTVSHQQSLVSLIPWKKGGNHVLESLNWCFFCSKTYRPLQDLPWWPQRLLVSEPPQLNITKIIILFHRVPPERLVPFRRTIRALPLIRWCLIQWWSLKVKSNRLILYSQITGNIAYLFSILIFPT